MHTSHSWPAHEAKTEDVYTEMTAFYVYLGSTGFNCHMQETKHFSNTFEQTTLQMCMHILYILSLVLELHEMRHLQYNTSPNIFQTHTCPPTAQAAIIVCPVHRARGDDRSS